MILVGFVVLLIISVLHLRWVNPPFTAFTLQEDRAETEQESYNLRDYWVSYEELPEHITWAVIASEDQGFHEHRGFDFEAIQDAMEEQRAGQRQRGASTISQQVAKNLYLWPAASYFRKSLEAGITVVIELFWSKERILEVYLNIAEFGPGVYGIGKSSQIWFNSPADQLTPEQYARLAAVLPSPKRMRAEPPSPFVEQRSQWILAQMSRLSGISYLPEEEDALEDTVAAEPLPPGFHQEFDTLDHPNTLDIARTTPDTLAEPETVDRSNSIRPDTLYPDADSLER